MAVVNQAALLPVLKLQSVAKARPKTFVLYVDGDVFHIARAEGGFEMGI